LVVRKVEVGSGPYQLWSTLRVVNKGSSARTLEVALEGHHYVRRDQEEGGFLAGRSPLTAGGMCTLEGESPERFERADILEDKPKVEGDITFGAVDTVYFTQALAAEGTAFKRCVLTGSDRGGTRDDPEGSLLTLSLQYPEKQVAPGEAAVYRTLAYVGPKLPGALAEAGHGLKRAAYAGGMPGIGAIAEGLVSLLSLIHDKVVPNWGVAIILLTLFVKLVLYPLTAKSFQSMAAMRRLKPEIDALNERYKDDREKKGAAMMDLYRQHKINPFGGCLPQLLQLPIWWALYMSLSTNVELYHQPFVGHLQDLTAPDPFYILPIALGVLMWIQQKITPSTMDPAQAKMMLYMMPAMITSFMLFLPAGLTLYMFTNSVLSIGQQRFIEYRIGHKQPAKDADTRDPSGSASDASANAASPRRTGRGRA
jgi:YidC/Oxa1 family membrane protein insertase